MMDHSVEDVLGRKMVFKEDYDAVATERNKWKRELAECREKLDQEREWIDTLLEDEMISRAGSHDSRDEEVTQVLYELRMSISRREVQTR